MLCHFIELLFIFVRYAFIYTSVDMIPMFNVTDVKNVSPISIQNAGIKVLGDKK